LFNVFRIETENVYVAPFCQRWLAFPTPIKAFVSAGEPVVWAGTAAIGLCPNSGSSCGLETRSANLIVDQLLPGLIGKPENHPAVGGKQAVAMLEGCGEKSLIAFRRYLIVVIGVIAMVDYL